MYGLSTGRVETVLRPSSLLHIKTQSRFGSSGLSFKNSETFGTPETTERTDNKILSSTFIMYLKSHLSTSHLFARTLHKVFLKSVCPSSGIKR